MSVIETTHVAGSSALLHPRAGSDVFEILTGRYLFEVDGRRFIARRSG